MSVATVVLLLTACSEDYPGRTESYKPANDVMSVYFPSTIPGSVEVAPSDTIYTITISRKDSSKASAVGLKELYDLNNVFTVPKTVHFAAGEKDVNVDITFPDLVDFQIYTLGLELEEDFTNPYDTLVAGTSRLVLNIAQTDWTDYAMCDYVSSFWDASWPVLMQYSAILDSYRMSNWWNTGTSFIFTWDGSAVLSTPGKTSTGYNYDSYGAVYATASEDSTLTFYNPDDQKFTFNMEFTVSAGSFGSYIETFVIDQTY